MPRETPVAALLILLLGAAACATETVPPYEFTLVLHSSEPVDSVRVDGKSFPRRQDMNSFGYFTREFVTYEDATPVDIEIVDGGEVINRYQLPTQICGRFDGDGCDTIVSGFLSTDVLTVGSPEEPIAFNSLRCEGQDGHCGSL